MYSTQSTMYNILQCTVYKLQAYNMEKINNQKTLSFSPKTDVTPAIFSRNSVARENSRDKIVWKNCRCDIGLTLTLYQLLLNIHSRTDLTSITTHMQTLTSE